jgi:biotin synthase
LESCARLYPGHVGTHLIIGLGETEREAIELIQRLRDLGVGIGLFSFMPASGTALAGREPPPLRKYRRVQVARWLMCNQLACGEQFEYDEQTGELVHYGLPEARLRALLADGGAFRTAGCLGCNRPYYNERPGGVMYNYPRPLTAEEAANEIEILTKELG